MNRVDKLSTEIVCMREDCNAISRTLDAVSNPANITDDFDDKGKVILYLETLKSNLIKSIQSKRKEIESIQSICEHDFSVSMTPYGDLYTCTKCNYSRLEK